MTIRQSNPNRSSILHALLLTAALCLPLLLTGCQTPKQLRDEGALALRRGQTDLALQKLTEAVERDPASPWNQHVLGQVYLALDRNLEAQYALEKAHSLRPNDPQFTPDVLDDLAEALLRLDRRANLYEFLDKQVATYSTTRDYLRQGKYLAKAGDPDAARLAFRKAAYFADPNDPEPYLAIADFYTSIGDQPNAIISLRYANYVDHGNLEAAKRLRQFGVVPGPTIAEAPPKPALLR